MSEMGDRLKLARTNRNVSQSKLAEIIGMNRSVITNIERGLVVSPQPLVINTICNYLAINKEWLINGIGEMDDTVSHSPIVQEITNITDTLQPNEQEYILDVIKSLQKNILDKREQ